MSGNSTLFLLMLLLGLAALGLFDRSRQRATQFRLRAVLGEDSPQRGLREVLQELGQRLPGSSDDKLRGLLLQAGYLQNGAAALFTALRALGTMLAVALVLLLKGFSPGALLLALAAGWIAARLFPVFLKLRAEARSRILRSELPPVVDMLLMVLQCGVSIDQSLRHVAGMLERSAPVTGAVLARYVADVDGGMPYDQAFERLGRRLGSDEGHDLANLIRQALLQGGEIMGPLERLGKEVAEKRLAAARAQIGRKSIYLTMVMLGFFMPVLLVTLAGPAVCTIMNTLTIVKHELHQKGAKR
jgi:tight adherence protein C